MYVCSLLPWMIVVSENCPLHCESGVFGPKLRNEAHGRILRNHGYGHDQWNTLANRTASVCLELMKDGQWSIDLFSVYQFSSFPSCQVRVSRV